MQRLPRSLVQDRRWRLFTCSPSLSVEDANLRPCPAWHLPPPSELTSLAIHFLEKTLFASWHFYSEDVTPESMANVSVEGADVLVVSKTDQANPDFVPKKPYIVS